VNNVMLVGRLTADPEVKDEQVIFTLSVNRTTKNLEGVYETDIIPCKLWHGFSTHITEHVSKGDVVGVRGRIQEEAGKLCIIVEKLAFLSSSQEE